MNEDKIVLGRMLHPAPAKEAEDFDFPDEESDVIALPVKALKKHVSILGSSGSGKTVLGKVLIEEAVIQGIPSIIIDPQGDLASLAIPGKKGNVEAEGTSAVSYANYQNRAEVRIFTPASRKGIPLSINPLKVPPSGLSKEDFIRALDLVCNSLVRILGYRSGASEGKAVHNFLYEFLKNAWELEMPIRDFEEFSSLVLEPEKVGMQNAATIITDRERLKLSKNLKYLSMGMDQLLFNFGVPVDMGAFLTPVEKGKVPVNVVYLNTLSSDEHKQFFVAMIAREIYTHMLQNPSTDVQLVFLIDEIAPYLPPYPRKPPAKEMLKLLFKQGRKYGVSCVMCTQNPSDVDYKAMAQASTWALGRMMAKQDLDRVKHILKTGPLTRYSELLNRLTTLNPGEFILISPDVFSGPVEMKVRYLITEHKTLDEDAIADYVSGEMRKYFEEFMVSSESGEEETAAGMEGEGRTGAGEGIGKEGGDILSLGKALDIEEVPEDSILYLEMRYPQHEALKLAKRHLEGSFIFKKEKIENVSLRYLPVWRVGFVSEDYAGWVKVPIIGKKEARHHNIYFHGQSGDLLDIDDVVKFSDLNARDPAKLDFLSGAEITIKKIDGLPAKVPVFSFTEKQVRSKMETMFGIKAQRVQRMLYPVWEFFIIEKELKQRRTLFIDAVFGKEVMLERID